MQNGKNSKSAKYLLIITVIPSIDFFEILSSMKGNTAFRSYNEWKKARKVAGKSLSLKE